MSFFRFILVGASGAIIVTALANSFSRMPHIEATLMVCILVVTMLSFLVVKR